MAEPLREAFGFRYEVHPDVYEPSEDSFLLAGAVQALPRGRLLEIGTGCGFVALAAARAGHEVIAADVNPRALALTRANARRNALDIALVQGNLLQGLRIERFDAIAFNPPYLPTEDHERIPGPLNLALDGGPDGLRVVKEFLNLLPRRPPRILIVASSLQGREALGSLADSRGLRMNLLVERAVGLMERLYVMELTKRRTRKD